MIVVILEVIVLKTKLNSVKIMLIVSVLNWKELNT